MNGGSRSGGALLVTLLVISLLLVMVLTFVEVVRLELRKVMSHQELLQTRADARLAMELAVGDLQMAAGPDRRVTGTAGAAGHEGHRHWTGVWPSEGGNPAWMVSDRENAEPGSALSDDNSVVLVPSDPEDPESQPVRAALISPEGGGKRMAWWVGDEGVKARVNVVKPEQREGGGLERRVRSQSPMEPDFLSLGNPWNDERTGEQGYSNSQLFSREGDSAAVRDRFASRDTVAMAVQGVQRSTLFHDVTVFGYGLPVNVKDGGLKADWSVVLDRSMEDSALVDHYMGARPNRITHYDVDMYEFPEAAIYNSDRFFLSDRIGVDVDVATQRPGPNLGIMWNYGRLWQVVNNNRAPLVGVIPRVQSSLRTEDWLPYENEGRGSNESDQQHVNSGVKPVLSHLQMGLRLRSEARGDDQFRIQIEIKPLMGLWNPYNVGLESNDYLVDMMMPPMVKIMVQKPDLTIEEHTAWLRLAWPHAARGDYPRGESGTGGRWTAWRVNNVDFEPGEVRLFSLASSQESNAATLVPDWQPWAANWVDFMTHVNPDNPNAEPAFNQKWALEVPRGSRVWFHDVYFQDTHYPDTQELFSDMNSDASLAWLTLKSKGGGVYMTRYTGMWNGGSAVQAAQPGETTVPARVIGSPANQDPVNVEDLTGGNHHMATWSFHTRTTTQMVDPAQRTRGWIESDPRALVGASRWDGSREGVTDDQDGWNFIGSLMGGLLNQNPNVGDGEGGNRGLVGVGDAGTPYAAPQTDGSSRFRGFLGTSNTPAGGQTHMPIFDVPTAPLVSVGQFQHAQLARYSFEPGFVVGNSYASVRIPTNQTVARNFNNISGFDLYDISYDVNQRVWDRIFFSTMAPDYVGGGESFDEAFGHRLDRLPNPRMVYVPTRGETSLDAVLGSAGFGGHRGAEALSSRIRVMGAFNVNSTSKTAWKAVLSSMVNSELPVVDPRTRSVSWENPEGIRFNRFGHVLTRDSYETGGGNHPGFWRGWRELSQQDLDRLAEAVVEEVEARGPFRSMAEFVNRDPDSPNVEHQRKGALQAALDRTVNQRGSQGIADDLGDAAQRPRVGHFSDAIAGESSTVGAAGFILQGDLLQALAPVLSARSDTFVVRAYSERGGVGEDPAARVWCEAVVQRTADYVEGSDEPWRNPVDDELHPLNELFGRRFEIVAFRWLEPSEIEEGL